MRSQQTKGNIRPLAIVACAVSFLFASGCKSEKPGVVDAGVGPLDAASPAIDQMVRADAWSAAPDVYAEPGMSIEVSSPPYMQAGPGIDKVSIWLAAARMSPKEVLEAARAGFSLRRASGEIVSGKMDWRMPVPDEQSFMSWRATADWIPDKPLQDGDYVAVLDKTKANVNWRVYGRERHFFHVGQLMRARFVGITSDTSGTLVNIVFTEPIDSTTALSALSASGTDRPFLALESARSNPSGVYANLLVKLPSTFSPNKDLVLKLGTNVGAVSGGLLDGLYTGVPGSGAFELTVPKNSISLGGFYEWWPSIPVSF